MKVDNDSHKKSNSDFSTVSALSAVYLWGLFSFFTVGCDISKFMNNNLFFRHIAGIVSFFFLFSIVGNSHSHIGIIWIKTIVVYVLFTILTKCSFWISVPVLSLLLIDQSIKIQSSYNQTREQPHDDADYQSYRDLCMALVYALVAVGFFNYIYVEAGKSSFSWKQTLFGYTDCN